MVQRLVKRANRVVPSTAATCPNCGRRTQASEPTSSMLEKGLRGSDANITNVDSEASLADGPGGKA